MRIEQYLNDLLYEHDCVIIPGFGGFIGNYAPASIHPVHHTFLPPSKSLLFNVSLKQNDGLLASRIVTVDQISYDKANQKIRDFVENCNNRLMRGDELDISGVGKLWRDKEGNVQFEQDPAINYLADAFGLSSFVSLPVQRKKIHKRIEKKITRYIETSGPGTRILSRSLKWAAILAIPVGTAVLGFTNIDKLQTMPFSYSGFFSLGTPSEAPAPAPDRRGVSLDASSRGPVWDSRTFVQTGISPLTTPPNEEPARFAVIVGAFRVQENAGRLITRLIRDGYRACLAGQTKSGLYRVSINEYQDKEQAIEGLTETRAKGFPGAWLFEK
jgi:hypothetical protein